MVLAGKSIDDIVKPHLKEEWERHIKPRWFVCDASLEQKREPGNLICF